ncbi:MAG: hypothetical protein JO316_25425 [Abitibacteriaceae bacterium]|nr:hypothetical protein [Abditibacteriaceae bacterium]MBV9868712.1 hypothetical protein [Abditibacteriaceae bacterium]
MDISGISIDHWLRLAFYAWLVIPSGQVLINSIGELWFRVQAHRQRYLLDHNVTIELSDSGGYQVVE